MIIHNLKQQQKPSRVVVIGASGFIGRHLVEMLQQADICVLPITSKDIDLTNKNARGLLVKKLLPNDAIVMLSALTPSKTDTPLQEITRFSNNVAMVDNLTWALAQIDVKQVVYISSDSVYQSSIEHNIDENTVISPANLYGMAHMARELMLAKIVSNKKLCIFRPCGVYGVGDPHSAYGPNRFLQFMAQGKNIKLFGHGEELRHHIHVKDVSKIIVEALLLQSYGFLNLASATAISFMRLAQKSIELLNNADSYIPRYEVKIETIPRENVIVHKEFNNKALTIAFPEINLLSIEEGLFITYTELCETTKKK